MTDDRTLERAARSWIEVGPTRAPDEAVEAALLRIQSTPQERDWLPWRFPTMTPALRLALLVGAIVVVLAGLSLVAGFGAPAPAVTPPSSAPSTSPSASPSASAVVPVRMPQTLLGDWQAEVDTLIQNVANPGEAIQLSLDWDGGETAWIQPPRGDNVYTSISIAAPEGELALLDGPSIVGCAPGSIGRYGWERSPDGMFLTLTVISDDCPGRAAAYGRTWVHSLSAVTDGGLGVIPWNGRWIRATLPSMRFGLSGPAGVADLQTFDDGDPDIAFRVFQEPSGFGDPCATDGGARIAIEPTTEAFVDYVRGLPGATVTTETTEVGGLSAEHVTVELAPVTSCTLVDLAAFHASGATDDGAWSLDVDATHSLWIVQDGADTLLFWYAGESITPADEQAVIDSIAILDALPTP